MTEVTATDVLEAAPVWEAATDETLAVAHQDATTTEGNGDNPFDKELAEVDEEIKKAEAKKRNIMFKYKLITYSETEKAKELFTLYPVLAEAVGKWTVYAAEKKDAQRKRQIVIGHYEGSLENVIKKVVTDERFFNEAEGVSGAIELDSTVYEQV